MTSSQLLLINDRSDLPQVLRDRYAGVHTTGMAMHKAWRAVSFRTSTAAIAEATATGKALRGIGVSGAPSGDLHEVCVRSGIAAVQHPIEF